MSPSSPRFTVAILSYNRPQMVRTAIESVLAQDFTDYEFLIIDDASTAETQQVLDEYRDRAQVIVHEENSGEMVARNTALRAATGHYIAYLDSDDAWMPWALSTLVEAIDKHGEPSIVGAAYTEFHKPDELQQIKRQVYQDKVFPNYFASSFYIGIGAVAIQLDAIRQIDGFEPQRLNGLDSDLLFRLGDRPGFVQIVSPLTLALRSEPGILGNVDLSYRGILHLIASENQGKYPGEEQWKSDRLKHLTRRTRNIAALCLRNGNKREAWDLYRRTWRWNVARGNWKFLLGFPVKALLGV